MFVLKAMRRNLWWLKNILRDANHWAISSNELQALMAQYRDDPLAVLAYYQGRGFYQGLVANQEPEEICALFERVQAIKPQVIVEIGTRDGASLYLWSQIQPSLETLVSIDLPGGIHGSGYVAQRGRLYEQFVASQPHTDLHLLREDSQIPATKSTLQAILQGRKIDFLFIDGDHRYEGVKRDYELYRDLVREGGLIAFYDIYPNSRDTSIQVNRLWDEIKVSGARVEEIVHQPYRGWYGIGVVYVGVSV